MAYPSPRRLQFRRGNTAAVTSYLGFAGEIVVNTDDWTIFVHDGVTVGGHAATVNTASITGNISAITDGTALFGNIIPSANVAYTLGNITHQWSSLYVSNNTIYISGVPLSIDAGGNLSINGNAIPTVSYVNTQVANVTVDLSSYALNANVTAANVGMKGYVDSQISGLGLTYATTTSVAEANIGLKGYVDQANTIQSAQITAANVGMKGYVDNQSFYSNSKVATYLATGPITISNVTISDNYGSQWRFTDTELQLPSGNGSPYGLGPRISSGSGIQIYPSNDGDFMVQTYATGLGGSRQYTFTPSGNITLSDGGNIVSDYNIGIYSGTNVAIATTGGGTWLFDNNGKLTVPDGGTIGVVGTTSFDISYIGDIKLDNSGGTWTFGTDGKFTLPGSSASLEYSSDILFIDPGTDKGVVVGDSGGMVYWTFNSLTGNLIFPDASQQATAYSESAVRTFLAQHTDQTFGANVTIQGNLFVNGNVSYISVNNFVVSDNIINLADSNPGDSLDLGFSAHRTVGGVLQHTGLVRDASANQWRLFSNVVAQPGTTVDFTNAVYDDIQVGNITSPTIDSLNANASAQQSLISSLQSNATSQQTTLNALLANAATQSDLIIAINANVTQANLGIKGYIDQGNTIQAAAIVAANVGIIGYINQANTTMKSYVDGQIAAANTNVSGGGTTYSNVNTKAYTESMGFTNYSNVNVASYLSTATITTTGNITAQNLSGNISITGNVTGTLPNVTITSGAYVSTFDNQGNVSVPKLFTAGNVQTAGYFIGSGQFLTGLPTAYSNVNVKAYTESMGFANFSNVNVAAYTQTIGYTNYSNVNAIAYTQTMGFTNYSNVNVQAYLSGSVTGIIPASAYSNNLGTNVKPWGNFFTYNMELAGGYLKTGGTGGISGQVLKSTGDANPPAWSNIADIIAATTGQITIANIKLGPSGNIQFADGTVMTTAAVGGGSSNYSNVNVAAYLNETGYNLYSNVNVAVYLAGNITTGNITTIGNVTASNFVGNVVAASVSNPVTNSNTTITAGSYTTTFDTLGNVTVQGNVTANYLFGNGFFLTGVVTSGGGSSSYGNANVAQYLQVGNIANISVAGNVTATYFVGNGALLTGLSSSYSNVQVATYLPTYIGSLGGNLTGYSGNVYLAGNIIVGPTGYTALPTTIAQFTGNANTYVQMNIENISTGSDATAEYVATANNGTDTTFFVDLGIANSNYDVNSPNNSLGTTIFPNDSYLYAQGNLATTTGGNLAIGTSTPNKSVKIFAGGINSANIVATVSNTGVAVTGNISATGNVSALNVTASAGVSAVTVTASGNITAGSYIVTTGGYGNISQVDTITANNVVATANVTVQGIGVTMPNRPAFRVYGSTQNIPLTLSANVNLKGLAITTQFNQGGYFDATTGKFTAPVAGIYSVGLNARVGTNNALNQIAVLRNGVNTTGNVVCFWECDTNTGTAVHFGVNGTVVLAVGDYLSANILAGNIQFDQNDNWHVTYLG